MKLKAFLILILLIATIGILPVINVKADENSFFLELAVDSSYYLRGDTATITVSSKPLTSYTLMVFDSLNESLTKRQRQTDTEGFDSFNLPIGPTLKSGTYTITANTSDHISTTWTSIVETTGYSSASFPATWQHKNVNYTIIAKGFKAESSSGNISIEYPSLPISFQVNLFVNNMTVVERLHNNQLGIHIDLSYLFIHAGMKLVINGSIPQPTTYSFKFPSPQRLKHKLDRISDGYLIFDWSDLRKAAQQCSYNHDTGMLTVNVPRTFSIDPYVFEDGFETGDFSAWTGTEESGATITVSSTVAYSGTYSARGSGLEGGDYASVYKDFASPPSTVYVRFYVYLDYCSINAGGYGYIAGMRDVGAGLSYFEFGVDENLDVRIKYRYYGSGDIIDTSTENTLTNDTWYCIELKYVKSTTVGEYRVYVDGVEDTSLTHTGLDTRLDMERFRTWRVASGVSSARCYWDCFIISESYIGPEASNNSPTVGSISKTPSRIEENTNFNLSCTVNDADGLADFENCTLTLDDDWGHSFSLKWVNSTNGFSEDSDVSNYCTLHSGTRTSVNSTAYTLTWTFLIRETFPEEPVDVVALVFDSSGSNGTATSNNLFTFQKNEGERHGGPIYQQPDTSTENQTSDLSTPVYTPQPQESGLNVNPVVVGAIVVIGIVLASTYTVKPNLKASRKEWKNRQKKKPKKANWGRDKSKKRKKWGGRQGAFE